MAQAELTDYDRELISTNVAKIPAGGVYVEIGTKYGGSAEVAVNANKDVEVHGVDVTDEYLELSHPRFFFHRIASTELEKSWNKEIDVLFIDADHDQAGVDWWQWGRHLKPGGVALFHDYAPHSPRVIEDCDRILQMPGWELVRRPDTIQNSSIFIVRKCHK